MSLKWEKEIQTLRYASRFHSFPHIIIVSPQNELLATLPALCHTYIHRVLQRQFCPRYQGSNCSYPCFIAFFTQTQQFQELRLRYLCKGHWSKIVPPLSFFLYEGHWAGLIFASFINRSKPGDTELTKNISVAMNMYVCKYKHIHGGCETDATPELNHNVLIPQEELFITWHKTLAREFANLIEKALV